MEDAVHAAACTLDGTLEGVHGAGDVFFEGIGYEDVIVLGVAVVGACAGEPEDAVMNVVAGAAAESTATSTATTAGGWGGWGSLLGEELRCAGYDCGHRGELAKETAPSVDLHKFLLHCFFLRELCSIDMRVRTNDFKHEVPWNGLTEIVQPLRR